MLIGGKIIKLQFFTENPIYLVIVFEWCERSLLQTDIVDFTAGLWCSGGTTRGIGVFYSQNIFMSTKKTKKKFQQVEQMTYTLVSCHILCLTSSKLKKT